MAALSPRSMVYLGLTVAAGILGVASAAVRGNTDGYAVLPIIASLLAMAAFVYSEKRRLDFFYRTGEFGRITRIFLVFLNLGLIFATATRWDIRWDVTAVRKHTLAPESKRVLGSLDFPVRLTLFMKKGGVPDSIRNLLDDFEAESGDFTYRFVDPDLRPMEARSLGVISYGAALIEGFGRRERMKVHQIDEETLAASLRRVRSGHAGRVYFTSGAGEPSIFDTSQAGISQAARALSAEGVSVETLVMNDDRPIPGDCRLLVVAGPSKAFPWAGTVASYLRGGGNAMLLLDPPPSPGLADVVSLAGIHTPDTLVIDKQAKALGGEYHMPVTARYGPHDITADFGRNPTYFRTARGVFAIPGAPSRLTVLVETGEESWAETDFESGLVSMDPGADSPGPVPLGIISETDRSTVAVFGDSDFAINQFLGRSVNRDLFVNTVMYILKGRSGITLTRVTDGYRGFVLREDQALWLRAFLFVFLPGLLLTAGVVAWLTRI